jgi:hypothetical protein
MSPILLTKKLRLIWFMVFNATFNNISVISWWSVLLVEESGVPWENHWPVASDRQLYHIMLYRVHLAWEGFKLTTLVATGTYCTGSCKSTTAPKIRYFFFYKECISGTRQNFILQGSQHYPLFPSPCNFLE